MQLNEDAKLDLVSKIVAGLLANPKALFGDSESNEILIDEAISISDDILTKLGWDA